MLAAALIALAQATAPPTVTPPPIVTPETRSPDPINIVKIYERVLRDRGMSQAGAHLIASATGQQRLWEELRRRQIELAESLAQAASAPQLDLPLVERLLRERDATSADFARRQTDAVLPNLRALSPADRLVYARVLPSTRSGFIPIAPPAPPRR